MREHKERATGALRVSAILMLSLASACAGSVRAAGGPPFLTVTAQALRQGQASWQPLMMDGALQSGDRFALRVAVAKPAYVMLLQQVEAGRRQLWPPPAAAGLLAPNQLQDLPGGGAYFRLDDTPRSELLYAVASLQPLTAERAEALVQAALHRAGGREVPPTKDFSQRGAGDEALAPLIDGAAVLWLRFRHQ